MLTIPEIDLIAKRATERIAKEFAESGFANPPVVTHGIARAVLEAAEQSVHPTNDGLCVECGKPSWAHFAIGHIFKPPVISG